MDGLLTCTRDERALNGRTQLSVLGGLRRAMGIAQRSGGNHGLDGCQKTSFGTGVKNLRLDGHRNTSFATGIKKLHLDGR